MYRVPEVQTRASYESFDEDIIELKCFFYTVREQQH